MGRLSTFAKNRILDLRFQKSCRIKQIAIALSLENNIKVSRKSISTFLKKYIETKSIHDKPRSGRNKKLSAEEIQLIGEVTRLNRDITAPKIKEYLNLNVSTYTILRASKLFEWNKLNPNSNAAKRAAALERQLNGEIKKKRPSSGSTAAATTNNNENISSSANGGQRSKKVCRRADAESEAKDAASSITHKLESSEIATSITAAASTVIEEERDAKPTLDQLTMNFAAASSSTLATTLVEDCGFTRNKHLKGCYLYLFLIAVCIEIVCTFFYNFSMFYDLNNRRSRRDT